MAPEPLNPGALDHVRANPSFLQTSPGMHRRHCIVHQKSRVLLRLSSFTLPMRLLVSTSWRTLAECENRTEHPCQCPRLCGRDPEKGRHLRHIRTAPPGDAGEHAAILASAERHKADLILIGGKGRGFLRMYSWEASRGRSLRRQRARARNPFLMRRPIQTHTRGSPDRP